MSDPQADASRGFLISLEGGEGAGKSTVLAAITARLEGVGRELVVTREPGGTPAGERIRELLLDPAQVLFAETELLLMFASRAQLVRETVLPALERGAIVVSDRFTDASFAYQGGGRGLDAGHIAELERWAALVRPDLTFLLDVDVAEGLARARARGEGADRIESERDAFFERVRGAYRRRAQAEPERFRVIDASQPPDRVRADVLEALEARLAGSGLA
ncbi:dTMP kinase [Alkalisalibacterium limincola]|uniref:Thymidylate kinase n=1 Tax=Alkalisalibacterium limincola TaxID=2699169 RepID=A0A5C8KV47_9GAMM|nr:dTMP kinase [Alkalisalibacterium limincola]TXK65874.1 dTMP kinase [Alkalisalibacterium limincola]